MEGETLAADVLALINTEALNAARILGIQVRYNPRIRVYATTLLHAYYSLTY